MKLFYYTQKEKVEDGEEMELVVKTGYSFNLEKVMMTYPDEKGISVVLNQNVDKLNPVEYEYKIDPQTKQKVPVKIKKFEVTSEPMVVNLTEPSEIAEFYKLTGGPTV
jgi:hypothetical protein